MTFPDLGDEWDRLTREMESQGFLCCGTCGGWYHPMEFAETIEEMLCERCASGIDEDDQFCDGMEDGFDSAEEQERHDYYR